MIEKPELDEEKVQIALKQYYSIQTTMLAAKEILKDGVFSPRRLSDTEI